MKKSLLTIASMILLTACSNYPTHASAEVTQASKKTTITLSDIANHWAKYSILRAVDKGYVDGYDDSTFRPDKSISRAEFIKMLVVAANETPGMKGSNWYDTYMNSVEDSGVYHAEDFPIDQLDKPLTRVEMAKLALRYLILDNRPKNAQLYDSSAMYKATNMGVIQGLGNGELAPEQTTTRAQALTIIERILAAKTGKTLPIDKAAVGSAEVNLKGNNLQEALGIKCKQLPISIPNKVNVDYKLTQVIAVDMGNPNAAYYDQFKDYIIFRPELLNGDRNIKDYYLVDFTFTETSVGIGPHELFIPAAVHYSLDASAIPGNDPAVYLPRQGPVLYLDESKTVVGHKTGLYLKSKVQKAIMEKGSFLLAILNTEDQSVIQINDTSK